MELDEVTIIRQLFEKTIIFFTGREIFGPLLHFAKRAKKSWACVKFQQNPTSGSETAAD